MLAAAESRPLATAAVYHVDSAAVSGRGKAAATITRIQALQVLKAFLFISKHLCGDNSGTTGFTLKWQLVAGATTIVAWQLILQ
jgi:hypothetical protein